MKGKIKMPREARKSFEPVEPEREDWVDEPLVGHVDERRHDLVDCQLGEAHAHDTIEAAGDEGHARLVVHLGEDLAVHADVRHLGGSNKTRE